MISRMRNNDTCVLEFTNESGEWFVENETFSLFGHGATPLEALNDFLSGFASTWDHYLCLPDDQVVGHGRALRRLFLSHRKPASSG